MSDIIVIPSIKKPLVDTLLNILNIEVADFEGEKDDMTMEEAMAKTTAILKFRQFVENTNNIDL